MDFIKRNNNRVRVLNNKKKVYYFSNRWWKLVELLEQLSGFWPSQSKFKQYPLQLLHFFALFSILLAVANKTRQFIAEDDAEMVIECTLTLMFLLCITVKLIVAAANQRCRQKIYEKMNAHFDTITDEEEVEILKNFANQSFKYAATYMSSVCVIVCIFDSVPILRSFYDYYFVNGELIMQLPIQMDYGFDHAKYWYLITFDFLWFVYSGVLCDFAYDYAFILQIRHVQALFKIVGMRLNRATDLFPDPDNDDDDVDVSEEATDEAHKLISNAINLHSECLEIVNEIEKAYNLNWFIILLLNTAAFALATHLLFLRSDDKIDTFRNIAVYTLFLMHFQIIFSQGQRIIDSSRMIAEHCYDCNWYNLPAKSRKLLLVMILRTSLPCQITGARMFPLSTETFGKMLKAGLSYYTVFRA